MDISITWFFDSVDQLLNSSVNHYMMGLKTTITPLFALAFTTWMILFAFNMYKDGYPTRNEIQDRFLKAMVILVAFSSAQFMDHIVTMVMELGTDISAGMMDVDPASSVQMIIDQFLKLISDLSDTIEQSSIFADSGFYHICLAFVIGITGCLAFLPFVIISIISFLFIKFTATLLCVVFPMFLCFAMFPATNSWFWSWLGAALNVTVLTIFINIIFALEMNLMDSILPQTGGELTLSNWMVACVLICTFTYFLSHVNELAQSLTGGNLGNAKNGYGGSALKDKVKNVVSKTSSVNKMR